MKINKEFKQIWAIPDVHGRLDLLQGAYSKILAAGYAPSEDLLVFLGDMVDRGPDSKGVLEFVFGLQDANPDNVVVLRGNHENLMIDACAKGGSSTELWDWNGGLATKSSFGGGPLAHPPDEVIKRLAALPYWLEVQGFFFSHAPVPRDKSRNGPKGFSNNYGYAGEEYTTWEMTWHYFGPEGEKAGAAMDKHAGPRSECGVGSEFLTGVCGHIHRLPATEVRIFPKYRMLDTGCGCSPAGKLSVHECVGNITLVVEPKQ